MPRRGLAAVEVLFAIVVACLLVAIAGPGLRRGRIAANETAAIATLAAIAAAQEELRADCRVDQDGDGLGEYGYLSELIGRARRPPAAGAAGSHAPLVPYLDELNLEDGIAHDQGYLVIVYLAAPGGPTSEAEVLPPARADAADLQEQRYVAYAWPAQWGTTGYRAFATDGRGIVVATSNRDGAYAGRANPPPPGAAFAAAGTDPARLDAPSGAKGALDPLGWSPLGG